MSTSRTYTSLTALPAASMNDLEQGTLGYAASTAGQAIVAGPTDITGVTVTVTVVAGRRLRISGQVTQFGESDTTTGHALDVYKDSVQLARICLAPALTAVSATSMAGSAIDTPTAGSHTYKLSMSRYTGAGTATIAAGATIPVFILVEDIGT